ncbi:hypothetical protein H4R27_000324 [Coemansia aciculifera]|nr:hypothetical protein H4R27_000324 [Coemansia aciculifera]
MSKPHPKHNSNLINSKTIDNPHPYQCRWRPRTICHGLLQCKNCIYKQHSGDSEMISKPCIFNRDMAAVLNFRRIIQYYIEHSDIPKVFRRGERRRAEAAAAMTTTRARGAARPRGAAALAAPTPVVAPTAMDAEEATAERSKMGPANA